MRDALSDGGKCLLRVAVGALMLTHGVPKLLHYETMKGQFPDPIGLGSDLSLLLAMGAEVGCAALLILGLFTRIAALPLAFTMGVACYVHLSKGDDFSAVELPLLYGIAYLSIFLMGPGAPSIDRKMAIGVGNLRAANSVVVPPPAPRRAEPRSSQPRVNDDGYGDDADEDLQG
ncbi:MAG: DoxX family protein [Polyangiales bacterium]